MSDEKICRYCHDVETVEQPLLQPCNCKGTHAYIHRSCLRQWHSQDGKERCGVCGISLKSYLLPDEPAVQVDKPTRLPPGLYFGAIGCVLIAFLGVGSHFMLVSRHAEGQELLPVNPSPLPEPVSYG